MKASNQTLLLRLSARNTPQESSWAGDVRDLVQLGLVRESTARDGRRMVQLTPEGKQEKARLLRSARRAATLQDLQALEQRLTLRIEALVQAQAAPLPSLAAPRREAPELDASPDTRSTRVLHAIQQLDAQQHLDGIVPLPSLRARLPELSASALDAALLELERQYRIDLKIANDPTTVAAPEAGIALPGRGLVYFAALR